MIFPTPQTQQHLMPSILYRERYQANNIRASAWELTSGKVWPGPAQFSRQLEYSKKEAAGRLAQSGGAWRERERGLGLPPLSLSFLSFVCILVGGIIPPPPPSFAQLFPCFPLPSLPVSSTPSFPSLQHRFLFQVLLDKGKELCLLLPSSLSLPPFLAFFPLLSLVSDLTSHAIIRDIKGFVKRLPSLPRNRRGDERTRKGWTFSNQTNAL